MWHWNKCWSALRQILYTVQFGMKTSSQSQSEQNPLTFLSLPSGAQYFAEVRADLCRLQKPQLQQNPSSWTCFIYFPQKGQGRTERDIQREPAWSAGRFGGILLSGSGILPPPPPPMFPFSAGIQINNWPDFITSKIKQPIQSNMQHPYL